MSRLAVMAHFDVEGVVRPHVRRQVEALLAAYDRLIVCTTAQLQPQARAWLKERCELVERANYGYDFFSYKVALDKAGDLSGYDEVTLCNDSYVFVFDSYAPIIETMAPREVDFWGLSTTQRYHPHVQSFFVTFRPWVLTSRAFTRFWADLEPISKRLKVISKYEVGLSRTLVEAGFTFDAYFAETHKDALLAKRRVQWWAAHRDQPPRTRTELRQLREYAAELPNPAIALADRVLDDRRLPYVKIDTLRYDPYGLGAEHLLNQCERRMPEAFEGVREYLESTAKWYPGRAHERLLATPAVLKPLAPLVRYGRGN